MGWKAFMATIEFKNINMVYSGTEGIKALQDINLKVNDGEFICLIGPSGCGKSTMLEIAAGLLNQTSGEIFLDEKLQKGTTRKIGVVFQDSGLFGWRTIRKNVGFGLEIEGRKKTEIATLVDKYIKLVGLNGFENKFPHQLSGGMRQRAGLARSLVNNPEIIMMDEPFSAIDHLTRITLQDEIIRIWQQEKKTIVFVTHDVTEAVYLATRIVLLTPRPGRIQKIFDIPVDRPRNRNDASMLDIVEQIYRAINEASQFDKELEYYL